MTTEKARRVVAKIAAGKKKPAVRYVLGEVLAVDSDGCEVDLGDGVAVDAVVSAAVGSVVPGQGVQMSVQANTYTVVTVTDTAGVGGTVAARTYYEADNDGYLKCRGQYGFPANPGASQAYSWTFPVAFVGEVPEVVVVPVSTAPENISVCISVPTLTGVDIRMTRSSNAATTVQFSATGRWK